MIISQPHERGGGGSDRHIATIGPTVLDGVVEVEDRGGWIAPGEQTERGFEWSSFADRQAVEAEITAWIEKRELGRLKGLRRDTEPFSASVGHIYINEAKLNELTVEDEAGAEDRVLCTFIIEEIRRASVDVKTQREPSRETIPTMASIDREERNLLAGGGEASELAEETGGVITGSGGTDALAEV